LVDAFENALSETALSVSRFEVANGRNWQINALFDETPDPSPFNALLSKLTQEQLDQTPRVAVSRVPDQDWIAKSLDGLEPVHAGRYFVCGRHHANATPPNAVQIPVEAGAAFGTGHHETTRGCLLALQLVNRLVGPRSPLDLGCGTGVLAIAMAKTWRVRTLASDIDPIAVQVASINAKINGVGELVRTVTSSGLNHGLLRKHGPYDIITANILAGPLRALAPDIKSVSASGGFVALSGLLKSQVQSVAAAFQNQGLFRWRRIELNGWTTLIVRHQ
jgi:ribosomal protein L11 methyltransferase